MPRRLSKVGQLRDMVNWCIENPFEKKRRTDEDEKMKAIEAYVLSIRKGAGVAAVMRDVTERWCKEKEMTERLAALQAKAK